MITRTQRRCDGSGLTDPWDRLEYKALVALAFFLCVGAGIAKRTLRLFASRPASTPHLREGVFAEARSAAHAAVGYAFIA
ncbi:hypothetical protein [Stappia sp. ES.058]|uniref:hypothetical protein n=1 Tax=Stappia sp. ES.058 TaxID=1881061 RepID=UPI00087A049F|nr:hypothetical protein [Stappia sp. ES.058]SDT96371.1 hypothetical protein SAMN05428979_0759 [Stappia sp. ES.058]